jgi:hypothetical protein
LQLNLEHADNAADDNPIHAVPLGGGHQVPMAFLDANTLTEVVQTKMRPAALPSIMLPATVRSLPSQLRYAWWLPEKNTPFITKALKGEVKLGVEIMPEG